MWASRPSPPPARPSAAGKAFTPSALALSLSTPAETPDRGAVSRSRAAAGTPWLASVAPSCRLPPPSRHPHVSRRPSDGDGRDRGRTRRQQGRGGGGGGEVERPWGARTPRGFSVPHAHAEAQAARARTHTQLRRQWTRRRRRPFLSLSRTGGSAAAVFFCVSSLPVSARSQPLADRTVLSVSDLTPATTGSFLLSFRCPNYADGFSPFRLLRSRHIITVLGSVGASFPNCRTRFSSRLVYSTYVRICFKNYCHGNKLNLTALSIIFFKKRENTDATTPCDSDTEPSARPALTRSQLVDDAAKLSCVTNGTAGARKPGGAGPDKRW